MNLSSKTHKNIAAEVTDLLAGVAGHDIEHIERVMKLALSFADAEHADQEVIILAVLLHDVDDYKIFGKDSADNLTNANRMLDAHGVDPKIKSAVIEIIQSMGYNRYLEGVRPKTLEGMIVSDADMCDAIGAIGILRTHAFAVARGNAFFNKSIPPVSTATSADQYRETKNSHTVQHFFDKLLGISSILMTESGREEGKRRDIVMVDFLEQLFREEDAQDWITFLHERQVESNL